MAGCVANMPRASRPRPTMTMGRMGISEMIIPIAAIPMLMAMARREPIRAAMAPASGANTPVSQSR